MIKIFPTVEALNEFAAERFLEIGRAAIEARGSFAVALSGGSTPKALFRRLAGEASRQRLDWSKVFFFFGDERNVPPDGEESNYRMARENLFAPLAIAPAQIFAWRTELGDAEAAAAAYREALKQFFALDETETSFPRFDLVLLGMGADGHTASLFPHTPALDEKELTAVANPVAKLATTRLTLTFPVINAAAHVVFLVAGEDKAATLQQVLEGEHRPDELPSQHVRPTDGELLWLIDAKAGGELRVES